MKTYVWVIFIALAFIIGFLSAPRDIDLREVEVSLDVIGEKVFEIEELIHEVHQMD